jgi:hypothetical protein
MSAAEPERDRTPRQGLTDRLNAWAALGQEFDEVAKPHSKTGGSGKGQGVFST